jgi:required for meiotic nuclear division protein 1
MKIYKITAINIAENIDFINFKLNFNGTLVTYTNFELFFHISDNQYISIFQNGVMIFANYSQSEISTILTSMKDYMINPMNNTSETVEILLTDTNRVYAENGILYIPQELDSRNLVRLVMNDLVQILGIDFYSKITENLLNEVKKFADKLEKTGKIGLSKKDRNKFIGRCLTTKNRIADNLYIFDTPSLVWDDENLEKVHTTLTASFNLKARLEELEYTLTVINENLQIFMEIFEHTRAAMLEIVVILLIIFEIFNSLSERFHMF